MCDDAGARLLTSALICLLYIRLTKTVTTSFPPYKFQVRSLCRYHHRLIVTTKQLQKEASIRSSQFTATTSGPITSILVHLSETERPHND